MLRSVHAFAVLCCATLAACTPAPNDVEQASASGGAERVPVEVSVESARAGDVQRTVSITGTLFGEEQAVVSAKVAGRVSAVLHDVGDELDSGTELARLEPLDYELAAAERTRAFEQALASLGLTDAPEATFDVGQQPAVERAQLRAENAQARYERGVALHRQQESLLSEQDLLDLRTAMAVAQAELRLSTLEVNERLAELHTIAAQLATARQRLADTVLRVPQGVRPARAGSQIESEPAPQRYSVTARRVSVGDYVAIGAPLFELVDCDPLELRLQLPERYLLQVAPGQRVTFTVESTAERFEGVVRRINPLVNPRTRAFEVRVEAPNGERKLRPGAFASAEIFTRVESGVVFVPKAAVVTFAGIHKLYLVEEGRARERVVRLGQSQGDDVEIISGLTLGERFVTAPPPTLFNGVVLREIEAAR